MSLRSQPYMFKNAKKINVAKVFAHFVLAHCKWTQSTCTRGCY